jgi:hypothetical protein
VLQVVQATTSTITTFSAGTWTDLSGLTASITPTSASSKILVSVYSIIGNASVGGQTYLRLDRSGTVIGSGSTDSNGKASIVSMRSIDQYSPYNMSFVYLDSPATTSALTYKVQGNSNAGLFWFNSAGYAVSNGTSTIIVQEVAG